VEAEIGIDRHHLSGVEGEPAREHAEVVEQCLFLFIEQRIRPVDRGAQRLVALNCGATAAGEEAEPFVDTARDVARRHHSTPRGSEFDRKWYAIESAADLRERGRVLLGCHEAAARILRPVDKELDRIACKERGYVRVVLVDTQ